MGHRHGKKQASRYSDIIHELTMLNVELGPPTLADDQSVKGISGIAIWATQSRERSIWELAVLLDPRIVLIRGFEACPFRRPVSMTQFSSCLGPDCLIGKLKSHAR